jgi:hypothetical protein
MSYPLTERGITSVAHKTMAIGKNFPSQRNPLLMTELFFIEQVMDNSTRQFQAL